MTNEDAKLSSDDCDTIILSHPKGDDITFDCRTKTRTGWVPSIDDVSNTDEIEKLGFNMRLTSLEDLVQIKQETESLKSGNNE